MKFMMEQLEIEPFINADQAAEFLGMNRLRVVRAPRAGRLPAHPFRRGQGNDWFFLKSVLATFMRGDVESSPARSLSEKALRR